MASVAHHTPGGQAASYAKIFALEVACARHSMLSASCAIIPLAAQTNLDAAFSTSLTESRKPNMLHCNHMRPLIN
eukprot:4899978-Amphidinium_carterae.2